MVRLAFCAAYIGVYWAFAPSAWYFLLLPAHFLMGPLHGAFVNWCGHKYGYRNYNTADHSRNTFIWDSLFVGETFQNNHHKYPRKLNFATRWYELDFGCPAIGHWAKRESSSQFEVYWDNSRLRIHGLYSRLLHTGHRVSRYRGPRFPLRWYLQGYQATFRASSEANFQDPLGNFPKELEFVYARNLKREQLIEAADKILNKTYSESELQKIEDQIGAINEAYEDVRPGDRYTLRYDPDATDDDSVEEWRTCNGNPWQRIPANLFFYLARAGISFRFPAHHLAATAGEQPVLTPPGSNNPPPQLTFLHSARADCP